jgi:hypothetical protein
MGRLASDPALAGRLAQAGRRAVGVWFDRSRNVARLAELLEAAGAAPRRLVPQAGDERMDGSPRRRRSG